MPSLGRNVGETRALPSSPQEGSELVRACRDTVKQGEARPASVHPPPPPLLETVPFARPSPRLPTTSCRPRSPPEVQPAPTPGPGHDPCRPTCLPLRPACARIWPTPPPPAAPSTQAGTWAGGTHHIRPQRLGPLSRRRFPSTSLLPTPPGCVWGAGSSGGRGLAGVFLGS